MAFLTKDGIEAGGGWPLSCVTVSSQGELLRDLKAQLTAGQGFGVATMNLDHVVKLRRNTDYRVAYEAHSHITADGRPIVWLSALAGRPVELVTGADLVAPLAALCAEIGAPVAMVGSTLEVLETAALRLGAASGGLRTVARIAPPMEFDPAGPEADRITDELERSGARVCLIALGAPKQEIFAAHAMRRLPEVGFVSVGAGLDFIAGAQVRAPKLVQALAMEWAWRLAGDPRRFFGRYAACVGVLPVLAQTALSHRFGRDAGASE
jgi:N-acetylglucosaminyldiphosphoundecaprenol N-acetyl-beta-D-mannosaminyltransferase